MTAREVFQQALDANIQLDKIEEQAKVMRESIGSHQPTEVRSPNVGDPTSKLDAIIDYETFLEQSKISLHKAIDEADIIVNGLYALGYDEMALMLRRRYVLAWNLRKVAVKMGETEEHVIKLCDLSFQSMDEYGLVHIKEAAK